MCYVYFLCRLFSLSAIRGTLLFGFASAFGVILLLRSFANCRRLLHYFLVALLCAVVVLCLKCLCLLYRHVAMPSTRCRTLLARSIAVLSSSSWIVISSSVDCRVLRFRFRCHVCCHCSLQSCLCCVVVCSCAAVHRDAIVVAVLQLSL